MEGVFWGWPRSPCHVVYTDYRPTPLQHYVFPTAANGLFLVVDERGVFREDNFQKAVAALTESTKEAEGKGVFFHLGMHAAYWRSSMLPQIASISEWLPPGQLRHASQSKLSWFPALTASYPNRQRQGEEGRQGEQKGGGQ